MQKLTAKELRDALQKADDNAEIIIHTVKEISTARRVVIGREPFITIIASDETCP